VVALREGRDQTALVSVDAEASGSGEVTEEGKGRGDVLQRLSGEGKIVGKSVGRYTREASEGCKEGVITQDEEERREGAALFDSPGNGDVDISAGAEVWGDCYVGEGTLDEEAEPFRKAHFGQHIMDPPMVHRIEGFRGVEEEDKTLLLLLEPPIKEGVEILSVVRSILAPKKPLLGGVEKFDKGWHDGMGDD
jgi:hypothetical protein